MARAGIPITKTSSKKGIRIKVVIPNSNDMRNPKTLIPRLINIIMPKNFNNFSIFSLSILSSFLKIIIQALLVKFKYGLIFFNNP